VPKHGMPMVMHPAGAAVARPAVRGDIRESVMLP